MCRLAQVLRASQEVSSRSDRVVRPSVTTLIDIGERLGMELLRFSDFPVKGTEILTMSKQMASLKDMMPCKLLIPLQNTLTVTLPRSATETSTHQPFPSQLPYFKCK